MFGLFTKKPSPKKLADSLRPHYAKVVSLVSAIDGPFVNLYEAGIFVASVATAKILTFKKIDPPVFADEFNSMWVSYLVGSYSVSGESPSKSVIVSRLQEKFPIYRELFFKTIDSRLKEKAHDNGVQLMWELFSNCTGKQRPEDFLSLVVASGELVAIGASILRDVQE
jgi:hypothetical protein